MWFYIYVFRFFPESTLLVTTSYLYSTTGSGVDCFFDENENMLRGIEDVATSVIEKEKERKKFEEAVESTNQFSDKMT